MNHYALVYLIQWVSSVFVISHTIMWMSRNLTPLLGGQINWKKIIRSRDRKCLDFYLNSTADWANDNKSMVPVIAWRPTSESISLKLPSNWQANIMIGSDLVRSRRQAIIWANHYSGVIMSVMAFQNTSLTIVYSGVYSAADQQSSASLDFVRGIHRWPANSPHKGPVTRKMFPFDDVII